MQNWNDMLISTNSKKFPPVSFDLMEDAEIVKKACDDAQYHVPTQQ